MMKKSILSVCMVLICLAVYRTLPAQSKAFPLTMHVRDPVTKQLITDIKQVDASHIGIVIIDPWNYHWCMTWTEQVGGMATRMNRALDCARSLGIQVMWAPTDVASMYSGWPQRQRAMAVPYSEVPNNRNYSCTFTTPFDDCMCGPGIYCKLNYGHDAINPDIKIAEEDLIVAGTKELYSLCKTRGITHLIYFGGATNICISEKPEGLTYMYGAGLETIFARDMAFAMTVYNPATNYTPSKGNEQAADDLERAGIPTILFADALRRLGIWKDDWITEPVRITPAGAMDRPYFFENTETITMEIPYVKDAVIRYTTDGSAPTALSPRYDRPFVLQKTTTVRTAAFHGNKKVSLDGNAYFVHMPAVPSQPDIIVSTIEPVEDLYGAARADYAACLWKPAVNTSYEGKPLRIRGRTFKEGLGMRANAYTRLNLKPEWKRFVALAGVDDNMLTVENGRNIAMYPKIVFKIFIDGNLVAESPVMRISQEPWRFDVPIPAGSRQIVLVCDDGGKTSPYNLGNWVNAGFCEK
ncbi:MAG: NPCBM/NEW2 domain-containing protein [Chitinophagaceae bacterium]|nr:NPCBM/NEW2 domain-containing protein [Chitinophagaceae bacterium]MCW5929597.1 NPCBM/NEW2 domain-containing protein [Chitinophagaceae bacterium]